MAYTAYECMTLEEMLTRVKKFDTDGTACALIEKAYAFAEKAHNGQSRKSGEPYIVHPLYVASILTELMIDPPTIAAALLHDTVEDCKSVTLQMVQNEFGEEVARLVDGVTKLSKLDFADREEQQAESLRKMILAMSKDIRVVLIKLADRLHNMRTLKYQPRTGNWPFPGKRWIFTRPWPIGWACTPSSRNWRICPFATSIPRAIRMWPGRWA